MTKLVGKNGSKPGMDEGLSLAKFGIMPRKCIISSLINWMGIRASRQNVEHKLLSVNIPIAFNPLFWTVSHIEHVAFFIYKPGPVDLIIKFFCLCFDFSTKILPY